MSVVIPSDYDVSVQFPDGTVRKINLFQMGMMAKAVKFRADHGVWPPSVNKLRLTKATICERFCIAPEWAKNYKMLAETLEECHAHMMAERAQALKALEA